MGIIILIVTCVINLALGAFILLHDPKAGFARAFAAMSLTICVWIVSSFITDYHTTDLAINDAANKIAFMSGYGIVLSGLIFTYFFPSRRQASGLEASLIAVVSVFIIGLSATPLISGDVSLGTGGALEFSVGGLLWLYVVGYVLLLVLIARNTLLSSRNWEKARKTQARLVFAAFCMSALTGLLVSVVIPFLVNDWYTTRLGPIATVLLVVIIVYAIARHGLFDVRLAIVRTSAYILSLATLAGLYYGIAYVVSNVVLGTQTGTLEQNALNLALALALAFFFQPIKRLFDRFTNRVFYKDSYSSSEFFERINHIITSTTDLRTLLKLTAHEIAVTLKVDQAFFVVHRQDQQPVSAGTEHHGYIPKSDMSQLDVYASAHNDQAVIVDLLSDDPAQVEIRRLLMSHKVALIMPLVLSGKRVGYLALGEQKSSSFTLRDVRVLEATSDELTIAIQNALSIEEVRELNATLQQRISEATKELRTSNAQLQRLDKAKDEFVSMASHQLRTPLTSVKGYISMVIEGDVGKVSDSQKHLLEEAFTSSERMVHLINDFLNVSRLQTGKFLVEKRPVDLAKVVGQELESLATNAKSRNLSFTYRAPKNLPMLNLDEGKMRQVIMNFSDNALYYSHENTKIAVRLVLQKNDIVFTVKDTGIGVPRAEQSQLFTKFYRASNARKQRPDGTGVGLFLAKKVIDAHGGHVVFESSEGKGSTFGFSLPLHELRVSDTNNLDDQNNDH